jgi:hypothetical protein
MNYVTLDEIPVTPPEEEEPQGIPGDIDGNQEVNDADVTYLLWHTLFPDLYPITTNGDITDDGEVNDADVTYLLWHTLFPELYPLESNDAGN